MSFWLRRRLPASNSSQEKSRGGGSPQTQLANLFRVSTDPNSRRQFVQMFSSDSPNDANVNDLSYSRRIESVLAQIPM